MVEPIRISAEETWRRVSAGSALLVCAYEDDEKFEDNYLQGAISFNEFKSRLPELAKDQAIIFYCAWDNEASAAGQAEKYLNDGYPNALVLGQGVQGWKTAGYPFE